MKRRVSNLLLYCYLLIPSFYHSGDLQTNNVVLFCRIVYKGSLVDVAKCLMIGNVGNQATGF